MIGNSRPQNQAIALAVEEAVLVDFQEQPSKQGSAVSGWILLDYGENTGQSEFLCFRINQPFLFYLPSECNDETIFESEFSMLTQTFSIRTEHSKLSSSLSPSVNPPSASPRHEYSSFSLCDKQSSPEMNT